MGNLFTISIFDIVESSHCTASEDGDKVFEALKVKLQQGEKVALSFKNVEDLTSAFLNAAVGQLYSEFDENEIKEKISLVDTKPNDLVILKRVVDRAKEFFKNSDRFKGAADEMLGDK